MKLVWKITVVSPIITQLIHMGLTLDPRNTLKLQGILCEHHFSGTVVKVQVLYFENQKEK